MKINYGINKRKGRGIEHQNHKMVVKVTATTAEVVAMIQAKHPGWAVTGYCPAFKEAK